MSEDRALFSKRSLEGEYTEWRSVWIRDYGAGTFMSNLVIDNYGRCYFMDMVALTAWYRDFAGNEIATVGTYWVPTLVGDYSNAFSATGKYTMSADVATQRLIDVWRDGAIITRIDVAVGLADANAVIQAAMSPNGKFIVLTIRSTFTGNIQYVRLYEGT